MGPKNSILPFLYPCDLARSKFRHETQKLIFMSFILALVGAFLPQTQSAILKKYAVLPSARVAKIHRFFSCPTGQTVPFSGTSSRKGMGNCNPHRVCRCGKGSFQVIGSHGETCSLLPQISLQQQNRKIIRVVAPQGAATRIFLCLEFVNIL
jgi:hypothetical protein